MESTPVATEKALRDLEFDAVKRVVRAHASCSLGEEAIDALVPIVDREAIEQSIAEVTEAIRFLIEQGRFSLGAVRDLAPILDRAKNAGVLDGEELLVVLNTIDGTLQLQDSIAEHAEGPLLRAIAARLTAGGKTIRKEIARAIDDRGGLRDDASPALATLTRRRRTIEGRIEAKLQGFMSRHPELIAESVITRRRGRLVIPIRSGSVGAMEFIVQDRSATGQTLYVEPPEFVSENNVVSQLDSEIRDEIRRILRELTEAVLELESAFLRDRAILAHLDSLFARAGYAHVQGGGFPQLTDRIVLRHARHPLIPRDAVVPVSLSLGDGLRMLVLTGPNTGGKTVTLKTIGLMCLMTQAGIPIPASPDTELTIIERVRTDIGDEQSISQNLSTFSAHMTSIVSLLEDAQDGALILLDELGAGTDPQEGAALGLAVIETLLESGALVGISTHLTPLKYFALRHPEVKTASMEFDVQSLSPTYRVVEGVPGKSNAFIIAQRLGFPEERIERARSFLSQGEIRAEDILDELERERQLMHKHRQAAGRDMAEARKLKRRYEEQLAAFENDMEAQLSDRFKQLDAFLKDGQQRVEEMISHAKENASREAASADAMRQEVRELAELREQAAARQAEAATLRHSDSLDPEALETGMLVHVRSLDAEGRIVGFGAKGRVTIDLDGVRATTEAADLVRPGKRKATKKPEAKRTRAQRSTAVRGPRKVSLELNVRGMTVNEALREVEEYLDQLLLADVHKARILHGKGTGALRDAVQAYLASCRFVSAYGFAPPNLGGDGVTEIELAKSS